MNKFYKILFLNIMTLGTMIAISSSCWITTWVGLEINLLAIIPLMKNHSSIYPNESTTKYFLAQAMASGMFLLSLVYSLKIFNFSSPSSEFSASILVTSALLMKMGAAPFHAWVPEVFTGLNWDTIYIIMTWQKIAPMVLLNNISKSPTLLSIIIIISSLIGGLMGLNQICLRKMMAFSSINHTAWMISSLLSSIKIWLFYFFIYCIINLMIVSLFSINKLYFISQLYKAISKNKKIKFIFMVNFLSLGGLPPFLGFLPKWITIHFLVKNQFFMMAVLLSILTLLSLYFYMRLSLSSFSFNTKESFVKMLNKSNYFYFMVNILSLMSLIISTIISDFI